MGMGLSVETTKANAMAELEPMLKPARTFLADVKEAILAGVDTLDRATLADWMFIIPTMYGELRCIEVDCNCTAELLEKEIDRLKAESQTMKSADTKVTDVRAQAALKTHDLQVRQQVAKYMARTVNALWSQFEMYIFSVRALFESLPSGHKVKHDV